MESDGVDIDFARIDDFFQSPLRYLVENTVSEGIEGSGGNETYIDAEVQLTIRTHEIFSYLSIVLNSLAILACSLSVIFIIKFRKHRILSLAQPEFLYVICFGSAVIAVSGVFLGSHTNNIENVTPEDISNRLCSQFITLFFAGNIFVYMALFAKIWRIQKVAQFRRHQNVQVRHVIWPSILMESITIGVLAAWALVDPPQLGTTEVIQKEDNGDEFVIRFIGYCDYRGETGIFFWIMIALILTSALLGYCMAKKIPDRVPEELHDGKQIRLLYLYHSVIVIVCVIFYTLGRHFALSFLLDLVQLCVVFFLSMTIIGLMVVPKCYGVWYERKHDGELPAWLQNTMIGTGRIHVHGVGGPGDTSNTINPMNVRNNDDQSCIEHETSRPEEPLCNKSTS